MGQFNTYSDIRSWAASTTSTSPPPTTPKALTAQLLANTTKPSLATRLRRRLSSAANKLSPSIIGDRFSSTIREQRRNAADKTRWHAYQNTIEILEPRLAAAHERSATLQQYRWAADEIEHRRRYGIAFWGPEDGGPNDDELVERFDYLKNQLQMGPNGGEDTKGRDDMEEIAQCMRDVVDCLVGSEKGRQRMEKRKKEAAKTLKRRAMQGNGRL